MSFKYVKNNRWILFLFIAEFLLGGILLIKTVNSPRFFCEFKGDDIEFNYETAELISVESDGSYTIESDNWALEAEAWQVRDISVPAGTYRIRINYDAENTLTGENNSRVIIRSRTTRNYYSDNVLDISNYSEYSETKIVANQYTDDLNVAVHYGGLGKLNIKSIQIEEDIMARWGRLIQWAVFVGIADWLIIVLLCDDLYKKERKFEILGSACVVFFASMPMFSDMMNNGHDLNFHIGRIEGIANELKAGKFPVRIYQSAYNGFGYASSIFYGEILLYIPAILYLFGFPVFRAYQYYVVLVNVLTCIVSYKCFSAIFENKKMGMMGSLIYTTSFYRIISIYTRAAVGEYSAMAFFPLVVYGMWVIFSKQATTRQRKRGWIWLAFGMTGVIQTHTLSSEMVVLFMVFACAGMIKNIFNRACVSQLLKAVFLTIVLNIWFLLPFLQYMRGAYNINNEVINVLNYSGLYVSQIFGLFPNYTGGNVPNGMVGEMPLGLGTSISLCLLLFVIYRVKDGSQTNPEYKSGQLMFVLGCIALWFTSIYFPWDAFKQINETLAKYVCVIQYPWRYLSVATIAFTIAGISVMRLLQKNNKLCELRIVVGIIIGAILITNGYYYSNYLNTSSENTHVYLSGADLKLDTLYLPSMTAREEFTDNTIKCEEGLVIEDDVRDGNIIKVSCRNESGVEKRMTFPLVYYSNYHAYDEDGNSFNCTLGMNNCVELRIPAGYEGTISVEFRIDLSWRVAEGISLLSIVGISVYLLMLRKREKYENV